MNLLETINDAFTLWLKSKEAKKLFFAMIAIQILTILIQLFVFGSFLGNDYFNSPYLPEDKVEDFLRANQQGFVTAIILLFPIDILVSLALVYIYILLVREAMKQQGYKLSRLTGMQVIYILMLTVSVMVTSIFSLVELKFSFIPVALVIIFALLWLPLGLPLGITNFLGYLLLIIFLAEVLLLIRNSVRLFPSFPVFFANSYDLKPNTLLKTLKENILDTWKLTEGNTKKIFGGLAGIFIVTFIANETLSIVGLEIGKVAGLYTGILAIAIFIPSLFSKIIITLYSVWTNYFSAIIFKKLE